MHWFIEYNLFLLVASLLSFFFIHSRGSQKLNRWLFLSLPLLFFGLSFLQPVYQHVQNIGVITLPTIDLSLTNGSNESVVSNLWIIYISGAVITLLFVLRAIYFIIRLKKSARPEIINGKTIYIGETTASFFNWIFISENIAQNERTMAIEHENAHVIQRHSFDRIILSIVQVFLWFNPAIYLLKRAIIENHEYLADDAVLKSSDRKTYGSFLLSQKMRTHQPNYHLTSNMSNLKLRIMKMNQRKKSALFAYLLVPAVALGSISFRYTEPVNETTARIERTENNDPVEDPDVFPSFQGGAQKMMNYLSNEIKYPTAAAEAKIEGKVFISMIITDKGDVTKVEAMKSPNESLSEEAIRVVSGMPKWNPGEKDGKKVNVKVVLPINFALPK